MVYRCNNKIADNCRSECDEPDIWYGCEMCKFHFCIDCMKIEKFLNTYCRL